MNRPAMPIPQAVRHVRKALGLKQSDFGERVLVARETVSSWEQGRAVPTHEQRVLTVERLADAPIEVLMPLIAAFGIAVPPGVLRARGAGLAAERASAAIRAAADELDLPASALRRTLKVVLAHLAAAGVSLSDADALLSSE